MIQTNLSDNTQVAKRCTTDSLASMHALPIAHIGIDKVHIQIGPA
jgi:hypothetical protein